MALIKCPDCGKDISDLAPACPNCGRPQSTMPPSPSPMERVTEKTQPEPTLLPVQESPKKKSPMWLNIIVLLIGLGVLWAMISATPEDNRLIKIGSQNSQPQKAKVARVIQPTTLIKEYEGNEIAADQKYKGERLSLTGKIESVGKDIMDNIYITLGGGGGTFRSVQCFFSDKHAGKIAQLKKGQKVTVEGTCGGLMMNVLLQDCEVKQ